MGWGSVATRHAGGSGGGKFLKLKNDGDSVTFVFLGDYPGDVVAVRKTHFRDADDRQLDAPIACTEDHTCKGCQQKHPVVASFLAAVWNIEEQRGQVLTMTAACFRDVGEEVEIECQGNPDNQVFQLRRSGMKTATRWKVKHRGPADEATMDGVNSANLDELDPVRMDKNGSTKWVDLADAAEAPPAAKAPKATKAAKAAKAAAGANADIPF